MIRLFSLIVLSIFSLSVSAGGVSFRGGGDDIALEFTNALNEAIRQIQQKHPEIAEQLQGLDLESLSKKATIFIEDKKLFVTIGEGDKTSEQESVAVNEPLSNSIWINRKRWNKVKQPRIRESIALHEVLSLAGLEGTGRYPVSAMYLAKYRIKNDPIVIVTGRDPSMPEMQISKATCEVRGMGQDSISHRAELTWKIGKNYYVLQYTFGPHRSATDTISLLQIVTQVEWSRGRETLMKVVSTRGAGMDKGKTIKSSSPPPYFALVEDLGVGKAINWSWQANRKSKKLSESETTELPDGSTRSVSVHEGKVTYECVSNEVPGKEWLELVGRKDLGAELETLNTLALLYYDAEQREQPREREAALEKFNRVWNRIFGRN